MKEVCQETEWGLNHKIIMQYGGKVTWLKGRGKPWQIWLGGAEERKNLKKWVEWINVRPSGPRMVCKDAIEVTGE